MVGIVIVSHSATLATGVIEQARQRGGEDVAIESAGGMADPPGEIGTDMAVVTLRFFALMIVDAPPGRASSVGVEVAFASDTPTAAATDGQQRRSRPATAASGSSWRGSGSNHCFRKEQS